jgi:hypothetical protein
MPDEIPAPAYPFPWMPLVAAGVEIVNWDGYSYVDTTGRTYWSGAAEPTEADALSALTTPRTPPAPVPAVVARSQFVIAARRVLGLTEGGIYALISQLPEGEQRETARDLWENAREFRRDNTFLAALAQLNGTPPEQIDAVFRAAAEINLD